MADFQYVTQFGGRYTPLKQSDVKSLYEELTRQPFDGVCAGSVAALLETKVQPAFVPAARYGRFYTAPPTPMTTHENLPFPENCVKYQVQYEHDSKHFFTRFMRGLHISPHGFADNEYYCDKWSQLVQAFRATDMNTNQISLINLRYELQTPEETVERHHMIAMFKQNGKYTFYDPNIGIAEFNDLSDFEAWLATEMQKGALRHFTQPTPTRMMVENARNKEVVVKPGLLSVKLAFVEDFHYAARAVCKTAPVPTDETVRKGARL